MFFSNLEMKNQNWTFINVLFSKIQNRFEKTLHHHFFSVRLPHFRGLTFMVWRRANRLPQTTALCCGLWYCSIGGRMVRQMVRRMVELFGVILGWVILGDVLKKGAEVEKMNFVAFTFIPRKRIG
jgi:hypothetical protein